MPRHLLCCLVVSFCVHFPALADVVIIDKAPLPNEVKAGLGFFHGAFKLFDSIAYQAEFENRLASYAKVPKAPDLNAGATSIEQFPVPAVTTGTISIRRMADRQWVRVEPKKVNEIQSSQSYATLQIYSHIGKETRILNVKTNIAVIDARKIQVPAQPSDMWMPECFFTENLPEHWPAIYSGLTLAQANRALQNLVVRRETIASTPVNPNDLNRREITTHEDFTVPEVQTIFGPLSVRRVMVFAEAFGWRPRRIESWRNAHLYMSFDVEWGIVRRGGDIYFPQRITVRAYAQKTAKSDAANVLVKESVFKIIPGSVLLGPEVEKLDFTLSIPKTATVNRLND